MKREKILVSIYLILVITYISFYPSLQNGFVNWDDDIQVIKPAQIRDLSFRNIRKTFTSFHSTGIYHPLSTLSYAIEYRLFKLTPLAYHTTNLILHLINSILVFWFIFLLTSNLPTALIVALCFGIHPLHVESVVWITERKDVLYTLFFFSAIIGYIYYINKREKIYYYTSLFLFILSLLSKPMAMTFPLVILLCDYILNIRLDKNVIKEKSIFFTISFLFAALTIYGLYIFRSLRQAPAMPFYYYIFFANYGIVFYLKKLIAPVGLSCFYPYPASLQHPYIYPIIVATLAIFIYISRRYTKKVIFGTIFFFVTISPVIQLLPSSKTIAADRYTYVPLVGLFYIIGETFSFLYYRRFKYNRLIKNTLLVVLGGIIIGWSFLTFNRCKVWRDSITLWNDVLRKYPDSALAYVQRGSGYVEVGEYDRAIQDYNRALSIEPTYVLAYNNLGAVYVQKKQYDQAISEYTRALDIEPRYTVAYNNRALAYVKKGDYDAAISDYTRALKIDPDSVTLYNNRGLAYAKKGDYDAAISDYTRALKIDPRSIDSYYNRGNAYLEKAEYDRAITDYNHALKIAPQFAEGYYVRGIAYGHKKEFLRAISDYTEALRINPYFIEAYANRGNIYNRMGQYNKAIYDYTHAIHINPDYAKAYYNRAVAYFSKKEYTLAWRDIEKAIALGYQVDNKFLESLHQIKIK